MKKVAIFRNGEILENTGGPSGYLYILKSGLKRINSNIQVISFGKKSTHHVKKETVQKTNFISIMMQELYSCISILFYHKKNGKRLYNLLKDFDVIHVHSVENAYSLSKVRKLKADILLTPHRPEPFCQEAINILTNKYHVQYSFPLLKLIYIYVEAKAYKAVSGFIFPSKGAMNIYKRFPGFEKGRKGKAVQYVLTGVADKASLYQKGKYRHRFSLNDDDKVLVYVGRHSSIKGYDRLKNNADFFQKNQINLICAGEYDDQSIPQKKIWHECGYIEDVYNLLGDADVVVVPNRNTYFDLIIIEALSMGKIVLSTNTGGNLDISRLCKGLILFDTENEADFKEKLLKIFSLDCEKKTLLERQSREFYENYCTVEQFARNYIAAVEKIGEGNKN